MLTPDSMKKVYEMRKLIENADRGELIEFLRKILTRTVKFVYKCRDLQTRALALPLLSSPRNLKHYINVAVTLLAS